MWVILLLRHLFFIMTLIFEWVWVGSITGWTCKSSDQLSVSNVTSVEDGNIQIQHSAQLSGIMELPTIIYKESKV